MKYNITNRDGMARYIMQAGKDIVMGEMSMDTAERIIMAGIPQNKTLTMHPTFCVNVGPYYFQGSWEKPRRRMKDIVCE